MTPKLFGAGLFPGGPGKDKNGGMLRQVFQNGGYEISPPQLDPAPAVQP